MLLDCAATLRRLLVSKAMDGSIVDSVILIHYLGGSPRPGHIGIKEINLGSFPRGGMAVCWPRWAEPISILMVVTLDSSDLF
jgi:hypothetical protein